MERLLRKCYQELVNRILSITRVQIRERYSKDTIGLHALMQTIKESGVDYSRIRFNHNEEGKLHSKYLEDRYEPAISIVDDTLVYYYYLFDGEIKDCIHPFSIRITDFENFNAYNVVYYSSERIKEELPIMINECEDEVQKYYNQCSTGILLDGYRYGMEIDDITTRPCYCLHDCMETEILFKFVD